MQRNPNERAMGKINILDEIKADSKLRGLFFLKILHYLSIEMRDLLTAEEIPLDAVKTINEINHKLYPAVRDVVRCSKSCMQDHHGMLISMLEKVGLSDLMETSFSESQREINELTSQPIAQAS